VVQAATRPLSDGEDSALTDAIRRGVDHLVALQGADGSWRGDYGGPMFLLPMYVAACYAARRSIPEPRRSGMIAYIESVQNADGSVGLHAEAEGSMFASTLCYVALRLLGVSPEDPAASWMRRWIRGNGTPLGSASWGKLVLALLNLYDYRGLHPVLPELWLLPPLAPIHPSRLWCHCRQVYLPMAYLYGTRAAIDEDELLRQLRSELYGVPYDTIRFERHRDTLSETDRLFPPSPALRVANWLLDLYERRHPGALRSRALQEVLDHVIYEDRATNYIRIGPVNAALNTLVHLCCSGAGSEEAERSFAQLDRYIWDGHDGAKMNGYNSTALWDTAFAVQAMLATPFAALYHEALRRAHAYVRDNQVIEDLPDGDRYHRHGCRGGWPFSDRAHGWPITDCTAEGFKCAVRLAPLVDRPVPEHLLQDSVRLMLSFQNSDGGWATYERRRGSAWLELLNPSQVFGDIMVDYPYVECTSACIQALTLARARFPDRFVREIRRAVRRGERFLRIRQRNDGSWEGSWAVCFTYGTWFAVSGLLSAGASRTDPALMRACRFLERWQNPDGGWGEHYRSCLERRYVPGPESHVANTAWALMTLVRAGQANGAAARRAARYLVERQLENGDWPRQSLVGVFNKSTLINYENYRRYFSIWALAEYASGR
jgi:squalene/oxidosqualene cyclase-like protein